MKPILILSLFVVASSAEAQGGRQSRDTAVDARIDAMLSTPNNAMHVPQSNRFATTPGLKQQAPGPHGKTPSPPAPGRDR